MRRRASNGFTLLEVLVALAVFGLLMAGLTQGMRFGFAAWRTQSRALIVRGDLDALDRTLRSLIARASPGSLSGQPPLFRATPRALTFTTDLPEGAAAGTGYLATRHADVTLTVDRAHRFLMLWQPHYRNRLGQLPPPRQVVLLPDVERLELAYWRNEAGQPPGWRSTWTEETLPKLIKLRIVRTPEGGRQVQDIVVAPMLDWWRP
jgi:general secretion pathway protein J